MKTSVKTDFQCTLFNMQQQIQQWPYVAWILGLMLLLMSSGMYVVFGYSYVPEMQFRKTWTHVVFDLVASVAVAFLLCAVWCVYSRLKNKHCISVL